MCDVFSDLQKILLLYFLFCLHSLENKCSGYTEVSDLFIQVSTRNEYQDLLLWPIQRVN